MFGTTRTRQPGESGAPAVRAAARRPRAACGPRGPRGTGRSPGRPRCPAAASMNAPGRAPRSPATITRRPLSGSMPQLRQGRFSIVTCSMPSSRKTSPGGLVARRARRASGPPPGRAAACARAPAGAPAARPPRGSRRRSPCPRSSGSTAIRPEPPDVPSSTITRQVPTSSPVRAARPRAARRRRGRRGRPPRRPPARRTNTRWRSRSAASTSSRVRPRAPRILGPRIQRA